MINKLDDKQRLVFDIMDEDQGENLGEDCVGSRVIISLFLNKQLLAHFQKHGNKVYKNYKDNWK